LLEREIAQSLLQLLQHPDLQQNHLDQWAQVYYSVGWRQGRAAAPFKLQHYLQFKMKYWGRLAAVLVRAGVSELSAHQL